MAKKLSKYFTIGILNGGLFYCIMWLLTEKAGLWYMLSAVLTLCITTVITFTFQSLWTWRHKKVGVKSIMNIYRFLKFVIVGSITAVFGLLLLYLITEYFNIYYLHVYIGMSLLVLIINFVLHNNWTWGETENKELDWIIRLLDKIKILEVIKRLGIQVDN